MVKKKNFIILAIETSCDETAAAVVKTSGDRLTVAANIVSSQIDIHRQYGGVVPEVAAREHVKNIIPVVGEALATAKVKPAGVDLIAVTAGPGLITALIVGVEAAKSLSFAWQRPLLAVNHMYAHLAANFLSGEVAFPAIALIVSGGHSELILLEDYHKFKKIGQTIDDAAGEAFDKVAKLLNLGYPGGPAVSSRAVAGNDSRFAFPRPMISSGDFNFSFSGLKTAVLYKLKELDLTKEREVNDVCASFEEAVVDVLVKKTIRAAEQYGVRTVLLAGGVAANQKLRNDLATMVEGSGRKFLVPDFAYCTDNAAMIGIAAYYLYQQGSPPLNNWRNIKADPNWELL